MQKNSTFPEIKQTRKKKFEEKYVNNLNIVLILPTIQ